MFERSLLSARSSFGASAEPWRGEDDELDCVVLGQLGQVSNGIAALG